MKYKGALIAVSDMSRALRFYCTLMALSVSADYGDNVALSCGVFLQSCDSWQGFIEKREAEILLPHHAAELYFEQDDMSDFLKRLVLWPDIRCVHPLKEHRWGQRVVRFYDPDGHIIEVGESLAVVAQRFFNSGMSPAQVAARMGVPQADADRWLDSIAGCR